MGACPADLHYYSSLKRLYSSEFPRIFAFSIDFVDTIIENIIEFSESKDAREETLPKQMKTVPKRN